MAGLLAAAAWALPDLLRPAHQADAAGKPFWEAKPVAEWTPEEIQELLQKSPWARQVIAQYRAAMDDLRPQNDGAPPGRGEQRAGECGLVACSNVMPGKVVVTWESSQPIREALHSVIPPDFNGRYVIGIRGLEGEQNAERLEEGSDLSAKGKSAIGAALVLRRNSTWLFGFSRELLPLDADDKDVQFTVRTGASLTATLLRATFNPREMIWHGTLAL